MNVFKTKLKRQLLTIWTCLFVVMTGYGLTLAALPYFIERMALRAGASDREAVIHIGLLTGIFALMQFIFAPVWGKWSDRLGRRPMLLAGLGGFAVGNVLFGLGTNLTMLYAGRMVAGLAAAAVIPVASAYVSDISSGPERGRAMAWIGSATGFGVVAGPALGAWLSSLQFPFPSQFYSFRLDGFSIPFFSAGFMAVLAMLIALVWMKEAKLYKFSVSKIGWRTQFRGLLTLKSFRTILYFSLISQFGMSLFEGTFALHGKRLLKFSPNEMSAVFVVCGLVMAAAQPGFTASLLDRGVEKLLILWGCMLMGISLFSLMFAQRFSIILILTGVLSFGMAMLIPTLATMISRAAGDRAGTALGIQNAANSLGQFLGPLSGGLLLNVSVHAPYVLAALLLCGSALKLGTMRKPINYSFNDRNGRLVRR